VSRNDYEGAGRILEGELAGTSEDLPYLEAIAHYYWWGGNEQKAIEMAKKALAIDLNNFEMPKMLSLIYAKLEKHEEAVEFVNIAVQNFKFQDGSVFPRWIPSTLTLASKFSTRLKTLEKYVKEDFRDPNKARREWRTWADEYLAWYEGSINK
jgi:tetratricopeptide (TPR) repeat protein